MADSLFSSMSISASGMTAQRARMDVVSENIANAQSTRTSSGGPYRRRMVVFEAAPAQQSSFGDMFASSTNTPMEVKVSNVIQDQSPFRRVFDPSNPDANKQGFVEYPNVNPVQEMVDLTSASRGFESNVTAMEASKRMFMKTLDLLK